MIGNNDPAHTVRLRKDSFDVRQREIFGNLPNYQVARELGTTGAILSQVRHGHRVPTVPFIAATLRAFRRPNETSAPFDDFFELVPVSADEEEAA